MSAISISPNKAALLVEEEVDVSFVTDGVTGLHTEVEEVEAEDSAKLKLWKLLAMASGIEVVSSTASDKKGGLTLAKRSLLSLSLSSPLERFSNGLEGLVGRSESK